jgi:hypothetical protein
MTEKCEAGYQNDTDTKQEVQNRKRMRNFKACGYKVIAIVYIAPGQGKDVIDNQSEPQLSKKKGQRAEQ